MKVTVFRIDDRLIHGQIVTAWLAHADAKQIIVADDYAAGNSLQKTLLQMATPKNVELKILTVEDAIEYWNSDDSDQKTLFLVKGPQQALEVVNAVEGIETINVGNVNMKKGKTKVLDNLWLDEEEAKHFVELGSKVEVEVRAVPSDRSQNVVDLIKKENLV